MKTYLASIALTMLVFASFIGWRTFAPEKEPFSVGAPLSTVSVDEAAALTHLVESIRIQTVSEPDQPPNALAMAALGSYMQEKFPLVHRVMRRDVTQASAVLFTWQGSDPSLQPIVLLGHMDVVPVDASSLSQWTHAPFAGDVADGYIWGRGTMDDKQAVFAYLEAAEALLREGYSPRRTVYLAFGSDEENDGHGQESIVALLKHAGVHPRFVLDEGGSITRGTIPNVRGDVATIGIAEKGYSTMELTVTSGGGHSSHPPRHTAIGILAQAITRVEDHPMPGHISSVVSRMMTALAPDMPLSQRIMVRNQWLLRPWLVRSLSSTPMGNALVRTTNAVTMFNAGVKDNVLPGSARAVVNFRLLPGDTVLSTMEHVRRVIDDPQVKIALYGAQNDPTSIAPTDSPGYVSLAQTVHEFFPGATIAPNLLVAHTDSSLYCALTDSVYRFYPALRTEDDIARPHGVNERLRIKDYIRSIQFMATLMRRESM